MALPNHSSPVSPLTFLAYPVEKGKALGEYGAKVDALIGDAMVGKQPLFARLALWSKANVQIANASEELLGDARLRGLARRNGPPIQGKRFMRAGQAERSQGSIVGGAGRERWQAHEQAIPAHLRRLESQTGRGRAVG